MISSSRLIAAPEVYPQEITELYTDVPAGTLGAAANLLLEQVKRDADSSDPYDLAMEIVKILGNQAAYHYDTNVADLNCDSPSQVECFARSKRGYCLQYASTMAMLLRAADPANPIPTRLVEGFLPGNRVGNVETVKNTRVPMRGSRSTSAATAGSRSTPPDPASRRGRSRRRRSRSGTGSARGG